MKRRSWLFVPGDSERKLVKAIDAGADVVIVDLEDAVALEAKPAARALAHEWLETQRGGGLAASRWVRINGLETPFWREDLLAVIPGQPTGILVPKAAGPDQLQALGAELDDLERNLGFPAQSTQIVPLVSETPAAALSIFTYASAALPRLAGLTWGAEDLAAALGARRKKDGAGAWTDTFRFVRAQLLLAAHAQGVLAIDTLHADFRDLAGLERIAGEARADGFNGMLAIHPDQVPVINAAFAPNAAELAEAQAIVDLFAANPGVGALAFQGRLVDLPHLAQAKALLGL